MPDLVTLATPTADRVLRWSAEAILVASALAVVAGLACRLRGRRVALGPAARHALWLVVLIKLMAPPLVHWPWSVPIPRAAVPPDMARVEPRDDAPERASEDFEAIASRDVEPAPISAAPGLGFEFSPARLAALSASARELGPWVAAAWLVGSIALGVGQVRRIVRFRRLLRRAEPAPGWLVDEADRVGRRLGVRVPAIRVLSGLTTPLLWCLGRPVLLVPDDLLESLDRGRWPAILAHELAHLRRLDPWVRRLELLAELVWWWNPLYWLTRRRLDFEAELACDAWVLWALPEDRLSYAESLIAIGSARSPAAAPSPSLGVAGSARSFERRLTMILSDKDARRVPASGFLGAAILALLALPSWTLAEPAPADNGRDTVAATATVTADALFVDDLAFVVAFDDDDKDGKDDDAAELARARAAVQKLEAKEKAKAAKDKAKAALDKAKAAKEKAEKGASAKAGKPDGASEAEIAKKMETLGKEMEKKFGPGSEFEKKMEALGKEMEKKFGPGSDFEKQFGPGSDFEKEMKAFGKEMEEKFGPGSKFAEEMKALEKKAGKDGAEPKVKEEAKAREKMASDARAKAEERTKEVRARVEERTRDVRARADRTARARTEAATTRRAKRIEALETQIQRMTEELKKLKAEGDEDDEDDEG